jgi:hypothetical protein
VCCADGVRGCPCDPAAGSPRARTYSGQRRRTNPLAVVFALVVKRSFLLAFTSLLAD